MELLLWVHYDPKNLAGRPVEFDPFVVVWTTDPEQSQTITPGRAVDILPMDEKSGMTTRATSFTTREVKQFPVRDPMADVCVLLYNKSESDGMRPDAGKTRPFVRDIGQINVPWHIILRELLSSGQAALTREGKQDDNSKLLFPKARVQQEMKSLVTFEGVEYEIQTQMANDRNLAMELKAVGPEKLSHRGHLTLHVALLSKTLSAKERLDVLEYHYLKASPLYAHKADVVLGVSAPSRLVKASQEYDRRTSHQDKIYTEAMARYRKLYDSLWASTGMTKDLIIRSKDQSKTVYFKPDVPQMMRFHLPTWMICNDRIPYAEWVLQTVPENADHLPRPTEATEQFLKTITHMAFKRVDITPDAFVTTIDAITLDAATTPMARLRTYLKTGSPERNAFIKAVEISCHALMLLSHATRYQGDVRLIRLFKKMISVDVEAPQHDMVSGTTDSGDCEDEETPEGIMYSLICMGRVGADAKTGGKGWKDLILGAMRRLLLFMVDYNIFGSVSGRQVSDAERKAGDDDEEGFLYTTDDIMEQPGGHTFMILEALAKKMKKLKRHDYLIDTIVGYAASDRVRQYMLRTLQGYIGSDVVLDSERQELLLEIFASIPTCVLEGTGRQAPLQMPLEYYTGMEEEFLRRLAQRVSEIDLLERLPRATSKRESVLVERSESNNGSMGELTKYNVASLGDASPYMFQRRLTVSSMNKIDNSGHALKRHISAFYRRAVHCTSICLHRIMPNEFVHLIWVLPERHTYGAPIRTILEDGESAMAIPLSLELHQTYLRRGGSNGNGMTLVDMLSRHIRRITPYDLSFQHLSVPTTVASSGDVTHANGEEAPYSDFFCRTEIAKDATLQVSSMLNENDAAAVAVMTIKVTSNSPVLQALQNVQSRQLGSWTQDGGYLVRNVLGCMVIRPPNGVVTPTSIQLLSQHVLKGKGVREMQIYSERILPWLSDNLCASFRRDIVFKVDTSNGGILSAQAAQSITPLYTEITSDKTLNVLLKKQHLTIEEIMRTLHVDTNVVAPERLRMGMIVELEHGRKLGYPETNVTQDDLLKTASIALAHFVENPGLVDATTGHQLIPDYYHLLAKLESQSDEDWKRINVKKPNIFKRQGPPQTSSLRLGSDACLHY